MVDIRHRIASKDSSPEAALDAVGTAAGVARWWIGETTGSGEVGGHLDFGYIKATVTERQPARVVWEVTAGPEEWIGTHIVFEIKTDGDYTVVLFTHEGWAESSEFMHHCSTKWGVFVMSLKQLLDTGTGLPTPDDPHIDNWA